MLLFFPAKKFVEFLFVIGDSQLCLDLLNAKLLFDPFQKWAMLGLPLLPERVVTTGRISSWSARGFLSPCGIRILRKYKHELLRVVMKKYWCSMHYRGGGICATLNFLSLHNLIPTWVFFTEAQMDTEMRSRWKWDDSVSYNNVYCVEWNLSSMKGTYIRRLGLSTFYIAMPSPFSMGCRLCQN